MDWGFNLQAAAANRIYLENCAQIYDQWLNPSLIIVRNFNPSLLPPLNTWLGSGLMNFSITFLKKLLESELRI